MWSPRRFHTRTLFVFLLVEARDSLVNANLVNLVNVDCADAREVRDLAHYS